MTRFTVKSSLLGKDGETTTDYYLRQLLKNRGFTDESAVKKFLNPSYEEHLHDPFLLSDMAQATARISLAIKENQKVVIYSDYDCDGIPGAVVLHDFFKAIGFTNFYNFIPHRHYDGFGLSVAAVKKLAQEEQPQLIITIDCGTTDHEAVAAAAALGIDVIITDHHEPKETLPQAVAVVNPKVGTTYPFSGLCGAAVVYKLIQALLKSEAWSLKAGQEKWWLDLVGIATIADMVPLLDENRIFAYYGLKVLRQTRRPGLRQLLQSQKIALKNVTEDDIGFSIGPRINAASRMDTPEDAFHLLASTNESEAERHLVHLEKLNKARKTAVAQITKEIHQRVSLMNELPPLFVFGNPNWRPSLVGLAANKLAEEHNRPAFLWGQDGNGFYKGSCRSGGDVSVVRVMEAVADLFVEYGGHHFSGGFTIHAEHIFTFASRVEAEYLKLGEAVKVSLPYAVDLELSLDQISTELLGAQNQCAPFGCDNEKPLYLIKDVTPKAVETFGKGKEHTKIIFDTTGIAKEAIAFFRSPETFATTPTVGSTFSFLAHLEESYFMGRRQVRLRIVEVI